MTRLNVPDSSAPESLSSFVVGVQQVVPVSPQKEETLAIEALTEPNSTVMPPEKVKAMRKRKTKSEYAAMPPREAKEKDKHKGGRPELAEQDRLKCVSSLVSVACYDRLQATSVRLGISVSQAIRWLIDGPGTGLVRQRMVQLTKRGLSEEERKQLRTLTGMAANLNQLAKLAHIEGYAAHATEVVNVAEKIRTQLKAFSR